MTRDSWPGGDPGDGSAEEDALNGDGDQFEPTPPEPEEGVAPDPLDPRGFGLPGPGDDAPLPPDPRDGLPGDIDFEGDGESLDSDSLTAEAAGTIPDPAAGDAYMLFIRGVELLDQRLYLQAAMSLEQARKLEPGKTSITEALGRAYFHAQRYKEAAEAFQEVVESRPDDDFSQFCLGRSLEKLGDLSGARQHMALAVGMKPARADYRKYLDRLRQLGEDAENPYETGEADADDARGRRPGDEG